MLTDLATRDQRVAKVTAKFRDLTEISDDDVRSALEDLMELGAFDDVAEQETMGTISSGQTPAEILSDLGIREPKDLDIEAIAMHCGALIQYKPLSGCEARIMGLDDSAIITINVNSSPERKRFSGGHELGHWMRDRGTATFQCNEQMFVREWSEDNPEKRANRFAADLLLPAKMFRPLSKDLPITFATVEKLATHLHDEHFGNGNPTRGVWLLSCNAHLQ